MAKAKQKRETVERTITVTAVRAEQGRRINNKGRKAKGEAPAKSKSWVLAGASGDELKALASGETTTIAFKNRDVVVTPA